MTCQSLISDLSGVESSPAATILSLPRTRRGSCDPAEWTAPHRATCCGAVHSAGSQLPLEGTERDKMAHMVKSRFCDARCATLEWNKPEDFRANLSL